MIGEFFSYTHRIWVKAGNDGSTHRRASKLGILGKLFYRRVTELFIVTLNKKLYLPDVLIERVQIAGSLIDEFYSRI